MDHSTKEIGIEMTFVERDITVPLSRLSSTRTGAVVTVMGDERTEYRGRILQTQGDTALIRLFEKLPFPSESPLHLTLVQALTSREKMAFILQKATELGVNGVIPCTSARSSGPAVEGKGQDKSHRWPVIVRKAVEQSRRRVAPGIASVGAFSEIIESLAGGEGLRLMLYEREAVMRLKDLVSSAERPGLVVLVCGPEGGFTEEEVFVARRHRFVPVRLGGRILRCETAAIAAMSIIQHVWGDL
jgi:16S rRNA (uracil1498-N3)-methyltransferase